MSIEQHILVSIFQFIYYVFVLSFLRIYLEMVFDNLYMPLDVVTDFFS